ncbi:MAG: DNA mismatch repair endonuclease MutL [Bacteroidales bacterium]|nr:DNA mismatch repair endonuclease MutL [Bacteroidales bacterium]
MSDIINLLPDSVANQIAAGEVVQRPASAVKELLENAVDAGADNIKLIIKDAGRALIQVIDNGRGMSPTDARMSFERHATSKIKKAEDLFDIRSMGFRGEALASIAAIAQVDLKTRQHDQSMGTHIIIEGSQVKGQTEIATQAGSIFSIKNLFFNTPARRNFLKSNTVEIRHIQEEFNRVALMHPNIAFSFYEEDRRKSVLTTGSLKQRIVELFGKNLNTKILSIEEKTDLVSISGFVGKPETARKTRGEQYFFVNKRFIKHPYLNHAVQNAFEELVPSGFFSSYFINFDIDPKMIDVNIHPTKTEISFQDERTIYQILRATVKMTLGKYAFTPQLDFEREMSFDAPPLSAGSMPQQPSIQINPDYNPFESNPNQTSKTNTNWSPPEKSERDLNNEQNWQQMYQGLGDVEDQVSIRSNLDTEASIDPSQFQLFQLHAQYIASPIDGGLLLINQRAAHERVLYDRFSEIMSQEKPACQRKLFPETVEFSPADMDLIRELWDEIHKLGFELKELNNNEIQILGTPPDIVNEASSQILEGLLEQYKNNQIEVRLDKKSNILLSMAKNLSVRVGQSLRLEEMQALVEALFECDENAYCPSGQKTMLTIGITEINQLFNY